MVKYSLLAATLMGLAAAQTPGKAKENHPKLTTWECTKKGGCKAQNTAIVLDAGSRPNYQKNNPSLNCGSWGAAANKTVCPDEKTCAQNCLMDGIPNYADYGITTKGGSMKMDFFGKNGFQSPRAYLLAKDEKKYEMLKLTGKEFTFDVDISRAPCGMNGALYLSEMKADGGKSKLNPAGASYGTGYCDAQCFVTPFVDGVGNIEGDGICCNEMDIWEANSRATAIAPHTCAKPSLFRCKGDECGAGGLCDKPGCAFNSYREGAKDFYGRNLKLDTTKPFTVVTQFPAKNGVLQSVERKYVQNGIVFENQPRNITMNDSYCKAQGAAAFARNGAMKGMGGALERGMVLAFSLWNDEGNFMSWLDGQSTNSGPCDATEGKPENIYKIEKAPTVTFSQIKWGEIGSTFQGRNQFQA